YLALIFGTLLSSQGTDASFVLTRETLSWLSSGRFPSVFPTLSDLFLIRFPRCFPGHAPSRFPFRRFRLYQMFWAGLTGDHF
ncbi:hypothetical protein, partial [Streptomyces spongiae]